MVLSKKFTLIDLFKPNDTVESAEVQRLQSIEIPSIQRDYAQGRDLPDVNRIRERFLEALYEALKDGAPSIVLDFVYGDINSKGKLIPLDGQQRLTTLFLLHWYIARHENVPDDEIVVLERFSYATRYSAREFYRHLVKYVPDFKKQKLYDDIVDQSWMPLDWQYDPTIRSMLNMIDAIHEKFKGTHSLWGRLKGGAISFYFLPIKNMGLTDDLYIKMNSRGKPLTEFEHFKAEWERRIQELDPELKNTVSCKIDTTWTDILWSLQLHDESGIVDNEFVHYFRFLCDVFRFKNGHVLGKEGATEDLIDLAERMFSDDDALDCVKWIERGFDCWNNVDSSDLFDHYISTTGYESGKCFISIDSSNLLKICCREYGDWVSLHNRKFPLPRMVYLYAFVFYLMNKDAISSPDFSRRLRIVVNLVKASEFDLREDGMKEVLDQTEKILLTGEVDNSESAGGFNLNQRIEEYKKINWLTAHPEDAESMFKLEDHQLMYGAVRAVGIENVKYVDRFYSLFSCNRALVDRALLTICDYSMRIRDRYMFGSGKFDTTWRQLFRNKEELIVSTRKALVALLGMGTTFDDKMLQAIVNQYLNAPGLFDWRRYLIKYETMHLQRYGMYRWKNGGEKDSYEILAMFTEKNISGRNWNVFLLALYTKIKSICPSAEVRLGEYAYAHDGDKLELTFNGKLMSFDENSIKLYDHTKGVGATSDTITEIESVDIPQLNGIDKEDRVELACEKIMAMMARR